MIDQSPPIEPPPDVLDEFRGIARELVNPMTGPPRPEGIELALRVAFAAGAKYVRTRDGEPVPSSPPTITPEQLAELVETAKQSGVIRVELAATSPEAVARFTEIVEREAADREALAKVQHEIRLATRRDHAEEHALRVRDLNDVFEFRREAAKRAEQENHMLERIAIALERGLP